MDENVHVPRVENRRPSDVFLVLWRYYILNERSSSKLEDFAQLADVWQQIRELEICAVSCGRPEPAVADANSGREPCSPRMPPSSLEQGAIENVFESDTPEAPPAKSRDDEAIGKAAFATRKRKAMERLDAVMAAGATRQEVADAGCGLTITDVMNILDRKPLPVTVWAKLEKALDALEAKRAPEAPPEGD